MARYQIVATPGRFSDADVDNFQTVDPIAAFEIRGYKFTGKISGAPLRPELRDQPKFFGLVGPMWGGLCGGEPVMRYEDAETYRNLSI